MQENGNDINFAGNKNMQSKSPYRNVNLKELDTSLSIFRLIRPGQISSMIRSLKSLGQLQPVIIRKSKSCYQLIDGFNRYYACDHPERSSLFSQVIETSEASTKAMILNYNRASCSLLDYEEAMVVYSLKHDHLLMQKEIAALLGSSTSWVCRRLALKERLAESVQSQLQLGKITSAHVREIVKLPRGNQNELTRSIIAHNVTSRQSAILVELYLKSGSNKERDYLLGCPLETIEKSLKDSTVSDSRLGKHGNRLLRTIESLNMQQHIFTGQFKEHHTTQLTGTELSILNPKIRRLSARSYTIHQLIKNNTTFSQ